MEYTFSLWIFADGLPHCAGKCSPLFVLQVIFNTRLLLILPVICGGEKVYLSLFQTACNVVATLSYLTVSNLCVKKVLLLVFFFLRFMIWWLFTVAFIAVPSSDGLVNLIFHVLYIYVWQSKVQYCGDFMGLQNINTTKNKTLGMRWLAISVNGCFHKLKKNEAGNREKGSIMYLVKH